MNTLLELENKESFIKQFKKDGVIVFKNLLDEKCIQLLINEINSIRKIVFAKISSMERPLKTYSDIAERHLGRLDYRCGFTDDIFNRMADPIIKIIQQLSPTINFKYYWGAIPSLGSAGPTDFHRDVYPILNTTEGVNLSSVDITLPPYYFTVLIPLVEITKNNGPTQFIKGSQYHEVVDLAHAEIYAPLLAPKDVVIFDGRVMHKGSPNQTKEERLIAYLTFVANWYHDQTFEVNNYLFPELSVKGR